MKINYFVFLVISIFTINNSIAKEAGNSPGADKDSKNIEEIKTFDFEKIFADTEKYHEAAKSWERIKCVPKSGFVCTKRECPKLKIIEDSHMILDKKNKIIALCKNKLCRYYPGIFKQGGVFVIAKVEESDGILIKILGDSRFKEISLIGLDAYITNGECERFIEEVK